MEAVENVNTEASPNVLEQSSDLEVLKKMEDEHLRLQRQVRAIQTDRLQRTMGVHPLFRRQDELLKVLKNEYVDLVKNLKMANTGANKKNDRRMKIQLKRALLFRMQNEQTQEEGSVVMSQLDNLIRRNNKNILNLRKVVNASVGQLRERSYQSEQRLVSTENRLETATLRFDTIKYENMKIRAEIEAMLKDRALFNQSWNKMMKALNTGKKFLTDLFESSTLAYDQRDEWVSKLKSVQQKGRVDQMLQLQEMRDLQKAFDHEMKLYHFLSKKGMVRINQKQEEREEQRRLAQIATIEKEYNSHCKLLDDITNYTVEEKIRKIIESFQRTERDNFSIYCLLTEYCAENVSLEMDLRNVRQTLVDRHDWNVMQEEKRQANIEELRRKIVEQREKTDVLRSKVAEKDEIINKVLDSITEMFTMLECSSEPYENLLGDKTPSKWLLDLPLRLITDKIKEYLEIVYYYERVLNKKLAKTSSRLKKYTVYPEPAECWTALPLRLIVPTEPCPACVETRWLSRVSDVHEVPFTPEMARAAIRELSQDPAYLRSDRIHALIECRVPRSRMLLAARNLGYHAATI